MCNVHRPLICWQIPIGWKGGASSLWLSCLKAMYVFCRKMAHIFQDISNQLSRFNRTWKEMKFVQLPYGALTGIVKKARDGCQYKFPGIPSLKPIRIINISLTIRYRTPTDSWGSVRDIVGRNRLNIWFSVREIARRNWQKWLDLGWKVVGKKITTIVKKNRPAEESNLRLTTSKHKILPTALLRRLKQILSVYKTLIFGTWTSQIMDPWLLISVGLDFRQWHQQLEHSKKYAR